MASIEPEKKPTGRPQKQIDWNLFEDLCKIQSPQHEIAHMLHINRETLRLRAQEHYGEDYQAIYERFSAGGKAGLRRTQLKLAQRNAGMAIFLGKQWLGQKDNEQIIQLSPEATSHFDSLMTQLRQNQGKNPGFDPSLPTS